MRLGEPHEELTAEIIPIGKHSLILGKPWLVSHNPKINWRTREITFRKESLKAQVFEEGEAELYEVTTTPLEDAAKIVPKEYYEYLDVFDLDKARTLPPLQGEWDFTIKLKKGAALPPRSRPYRLT